MKIEIARKEDYQSIRKLWEMIFQEDSKAYLDFYFEVVMNRNVVLIIKEDNMLVGMLHLNPYKVKGLETSIYYIVGVATHPNYRRKGIMKLMLDYAHSLASEKDMELILLPEDERFYKPFGYEFVSNQYNTTIEASLYLSLILDEEVSYSICLEEDFIKWFEINNYKERYYEVIHDKSYLQSLYKELTCEGGHVSTINGHLVLYYLEDVLEIRKIYFKDTSDKELSHIVSKLLQLAQGKQIVIHEVNERIISKVFSYSRKNNYDYRPYMMRFVKDNNRTVVLDEKDNNRSIFFDEVV